jgi:hypothetical protein
MAGEHSKDSFVARIWLESGGNGDTTWRGHIRHVQGKEEEYFQDLMGMREFLGRVSGVTGPAQAAQALKLAAQSEPSANSEPSAKPEPSANPESGAVTNKKQRNWSAMHMRPIEQPTEAGATKAQGDPKSPQAEIKWGARLFFGVLIPVLVFFWWLLIYSGGVAGNHA